MSDVDVGQLFSLVDALNTKSKKFSDAAQTLLQQAQGLDGKAQSLYDNTTTWAGKGSRAFQASWLKYHGSTINAALTLDGTAQALSKLAGQLNTHAQKIQELQDAANAGIGVTILLGIADVAQLGLDPVTDGATVGTGGAAAAAESAIADEEAAIVSLDAEVSSDLEAVASQVLDSIPLSELDLPPVDLGELEYLESDMTIEEQEAIDTIGGNPSDLISDDPVTGGGFPEEDWLPYEPNGELFPQTYDGSCLAACGKMILNDEGIMQPEAFVRQAAGIDAMEGGYLSNMPTALNELGSSSTFTYQEGLTVDQLGSATADGDSAIVSIKLPGGGAHAIVVDGIEDGTVLIRDPAGDSYGVSIENFLKQWDGKAVTVNH